jgi:uncharacterized membrane protein YfcA
MSSPALFVSKIATFREFGAMPLPSIIRGLLIGTAVIAGTFIGREVVQRMSVRIFQLILDGLLLCSGLSLLWEAWASAGFGGRRAINNGFLPAVVPEPRP